MRFFKLYITAIFVFMGTVFSVNYREQFLQANEFYKDGKVEEALSLYEGIPNKGGVVFYNLGNCAYKLG